MQLVLEAATRRSGVGSAVQPFAQLHARCNSPSISLVSALGFRVVCVVVLLEGLLLSFSVSEARLGIEGV
jgi:hypothetical protein